MISFLRDVRTVLTHSTATHILGDGDIIYKVPVSLDALSKENVSSRGYSNNVTVFTERFEGYWVVNFAC